MTDCKNMRQIAEEMKLKPLIKQEHLIACIEEFEILLTALEEDIISSKTKKEAKNYIKWVRSKIYTEKKATIKKERFNISEKERYFGDELARSVADKLNSFWGADICSLKDNLLKINSKNAYDFFKSYSEVKNKINNIITDIFSNTHYSKHNQCMAYMLNPVKMLLEQAEEYHLSSALEYKRLHDIFKQMELKAKNSQTVYSQQDAKNIDNAINQLIYKIDNLLSSNL